MLIIVLLSYTMLIRVLVSFLKIKVGIKFYRMLEINFDLVFNERNLVSILAVLFIRIIVLLFSCSYLYGHIIKLYVFIFFLFVSRIRIVVFFDNFYWLTAGWDGLGVVSFYLIIYYTRVTRINNGIFTLLQNRLGDYFFLIFLFLIMNLSLDNIILFWRLFLLIGRSVKRAQFPFNSWSLAAMSAPTPISSLAHSSTLVVAGIFITFKHRFSLLRLRILLIFRSVSASVSIAGLIKEVDIKKLIAYSTINHVSTIVFFIRIGLYKIAYFHLNAHAIFKSLIFTRFGYVIISSFHGQDNRLVRILFLCPLMKIIFPFSSISLAGPPFTSAFFPKDFIVECIVKEIRLSIFVLLLINLGLSVYHVIKIVSLSIKNRTIGTLHRFGILRVLIGMICIISSINIFTRIILLINYEIVILKHFTYTYVIFSLPWLRVSFYFSIKSFNSLDLKSNWLITSLLEVEMSYMWVRANFNSKLVLSMNWWGLILIVIFF